MSNTEAAKRVMTTNVKHAESPRWHDDRLWFSDVHGYKLHTMDVDGNMTTVAEAPARPSGIGFMPDGRPLLVTSLDKRLNWVGDDGLVEACDLSEMALGLVADMVVDGHGRAYVSDTGFDHGADQERQPGQVILFTEQDGPRVVADNIQYPNGCAVSPDGKRYYVAESFGERVSVFDIQEDGSLTNREVLATIPTITDGLCLDAEGHVWVALPTERRYGRFSPDGDMVDELPSMGTLATACVLGGPDGTTLFLCSVNSTIETLSKGITEGMIESIEVDVPGAGWP